LSRWKWLLSRCDSCGVMFMLCSKLLTVKINLIINTHEDRLRPVLDQSEYFQKCKDRGPDCGCGLLQSWEFAVLSVRVQSSSGLFPVVRLDFQTLGGRDQLLMPAFMKMHVPTIYSFHLANIILPMVGSPIVISFFCKETLRFALHRFHASDISSDRLPTRRPLLRSS
jgi:hypothetical protein